MNRTIFLNGVLGIVGLCVAAVILKKHVSREEERNAAFRVALAEIQLMPRFVVFENPDKATSNSYPTVTN